MVKKILVLSLLLFTTIFGRTVYEIERLDIVANIERDGSLEVEERVIYDIGKINGILYNIDALGYGKFTDLQIFYEDDGEFKQARNNTAPSEGNFTVSVDDGLYKIKLYAPSQNERKEFIFRYNLTRGVTVYRDIAQLNRKMLGKDWQNSIGNISVTVNLPENVKKDDIYAFGHGPLTGNIEILDGKSVRYTLNDYRPGEFLEVNLLFPKNILTSFNPLLMKNKSALKEILDMEGKLAKEANDARKRAIIGFYLGRVVLVLAVAWWLFLVVFIYLKNSKRYKVENEYGEYFRELPDDYSPSIAGTLVSRNLYPSGRELFAMLLDLVRKGHLKLEEGEKTTTLILQESGKPLSEEEKFILNWYIRELGDGEKIILESVEASIKGRGGAKEFNRNYERWRTIVYSDMLEKNLKMDKRDKFSTSLGIFTGIAYFIGGGMLVVYFQSELFILMILLGFILLPYTFSRKRASLEKEKAISRWEAFKKFLVDYSNLEEAKLASIELWEHYFVYAVALGVAEKVAKGYSKIMSKKGEESTIIGGRGYRNNSLMNMYLYSHAFRSMERNTSFVAQRAMESVARSSRSSARGRGGGFSGGSSGGGGGRSGGGAF
ncbi:DUF2207 domain-containing protein [Fusobacterium mortiferum]|uniref:DUF2207 domain-containing protein n=1 Tax=Fusobacterium mortiferum ATCC 9817 TaxID=469616 RepID=A0ABN5J7W0_FUSMR|nr:DUF2207 domain-containing protein [Fusobacterium mortiferum]AVQ18615.1 DUF2207 domain-containing protein [Fusobacterium mortiferum ATCC 9817]EEO34858.1 hypothetical protein FMAG_00420 [Fusobacterium mortiferum ATCC 9817]